MELFDFIFRLGVVFAIYGFLWGIIDIAIRILTGRKERATGEVYILRGFKYAILSIVTFIMCNSGNFNGDMNFTTQLIMAGLILLTYFIGKLQRNQNRKKMFQVVGTMMPKNVVSNFNFKAEIIIISIALALFASLNFYPQIADNAISKWFVESIIDIEDTAIIGFVFKVIGFFFLLSIIIKMLNGVSYILNGGKPKEPKNPFDQGNDQDNNDNFDDYEEIT